jgi:hypothetical protein
MNGSGTQHARLVRIVSFQSPRMSCARIALFWTFQIVPQRLEREEESRAATLEEDVRVAYTDPSEPFGHSLAKNTHAGRKQMEDTSWVTTPSPNAKA